MTNTNPQTSATIKTVAFIGHKYERECERYEKKSRYNDTRDDVMDGVADACADALDFLAFEPDIIASFESNIRHAVNMKVHYEKTTNYHDKEYYRAYGITLYQIKRHYILAISQL